MWLTPFSVFLNVSMLVQSMLRRYSGPSVMWHPLKFSISATRQSHRVHLRILICVPKQNFRRKLVNESIEERQKHNGGSLKSKYYLNDRPFMTILSHVRQELRCRRLSMAANTAEITPSQHYRNHIPRLCPFYLHRLLFHRFWSERTL